MWLDNLKELKKKSGMSSKQIADGTNLPERTVTRIFSGSNSPLMTTLIPIVNILGGSLDDIFADTKVIVATESTAELKENVEIVTAEKETVTAEKELLAAENTILKNKVATLTAEIDMLKLQLMHKEELLALHNYYNKLNTNK